MADALGAFPAVIFSPSDAVLVAGAPVERRRFLDVMLALSSRPYLIALQRYRGALARRNAAMREMRLNHAAREACAAVWEPALAEHGAVHLRRAPGVGAALCGTVREPLRRDRRARRGDDALRELARRDDARMRRTRCWRRSRRSGRST